MAAPLPAAADEARVLMLYGIDPYLPPFLAMDRAMREGLAKATDRRINFFSESLDSQRFAMEKLEPEMAALLAKKYNGLPINVVVAVSQTALDFFERHGAQLWPGARVVFVGFLGYEFKPSALPPGALAVLSTLDVAGTIEIARRLQPNPRSIVVISGMSEVDRRTEKQARDELAKLNEQASVEFLSGLPLAELEAQVAAVPPDSTIIYLAQFRDRDGRPYEPHDVLRAVVKASRSPVYGAAETFIGLGAVAGSVASYESRGRLIGEQVLRTLTGEPPDPSHAVLAAPNRCVADARALQRWSLDAGRLGSDCEIRFAYVPIWRQYWWQIALTLAIVAGQALLIATLMVQRRRRQMAEAESQKRSAETAHMNRRAVMGELTASIAHELNQPLGAIYNNAAAAQILIKGASPDLTEVGEILDDIKQDDKHASEVISRIRGMLRKTPSQIEALDLNEVIGATVKLLAFNASDSGVQIRTQLESNLPRVRGDRVQLQQVVMNLVLNAIEAMHGQPEGGRQVLIRSRQTNAKEAEVTITDSGSGIPAESFSQIFDPFVTAKEGGMGLGLSISRTIVEAHGGRIWAENHPIRGAVFHFLIPLYSGMPA